MAGHQINSLVPVRQDPPAPNILDPDLHCGLYNMNAYVRGGAVEAIGKFYGANAMAMASRKESDAKARVKHHASANANIPYTPRTLTNEELAAFKELVEEEATAAVGEDEREGEPAGPEKEREKPAVGAAVLEKKREEETVEAEKGEGEPAVPATAVVEKEGAAGAGAAGAAGAAAGEIGGKQPAENQKKKKKVCYRCTNVSDGC